MRRQRRGAYAIELAMLFPVFVWMCTGIIEYSWLSYHVNSLSQAATFGCRSGSLVDPGLKESGSSALVLTATTAMKKEFENHGPGCGSGSGCSTSAVLVGSRPSRALKCTIAVPYVPLTGVVPVPEQLSGEAVVRLEFQRSAS
jgi:hypothetical protein